MPLPLDLRLALAPLDTYRQLTAAPSEGSWSRALERPALVAVIIGTAVTLSAADRAPVGLVAMGILCWSFVPALQLLVGALVSGMAPTRSISLARSIELLFIAQLPWSLWVLAMTGFYRFSPVNPGLGLQLSFLLVPGVWTVVIVSAFCQTALGCTKRRAWCLTAVHQVLTWALFFGYVLLVSSVWVRIVAVVGR